MLCKPPGPTSHDCVVAVRRLARTARAGHAGTLDPPAAGVLPICVGPATRLSEYLSGADKEYRAWIRFGAATDTLDAAGRVTARVPADRLTQESVQVALPAFVGEIEQVPPMVSAVKIGGLRLYRAARGGVEVDRPPRRVVIHELELLDWRPAEPADPGPAALVRVVCGKGTYVRALAVDLAAALGAVAHVEFLLRTRSGRFALDAALTLEELVEAAPGGWAGALHPPSQAVAHLPRLEIDGRSARSLRRDGLWRWGPRPALPPGAVRVEAPGGDLVAIASVAPGGAVATRKVFPEEPAR